MRQKNDSHRHALKQLRVLITTAEMLAQGVHQSSSKILEIVHQQLSKLMDTNNMYIALYDEATETIRFGLAFADGRPINVEAERIWQPRWAGKGRTEKIIRTRKPLFHATRAEAEAWYSQPERLEYFGHLPASWIGVPMMVGERMLGVIAVYHPTQDYVYSKDDLEILQTMANLAAIALDNVALFEEKDLAIRSLREAQKKNIAAGRLIVANTIAAEFVHRMNNIAGTIPVRVGQIRELLDPSDVNYTKMVRYLDVINQDIDGLLKTAQAIKASKTEEPLEMVDIGTLVSTALKRIPAPADIAIHDKCDKNLPQVLVFSGQLVDTLENLIRNSIEAIDGSGSVTITCGTLVKDSQEWVMVRVEDTGHGIAPADLDRIFDLFYSTKPGGMGFALWRARTLVESLGGRIEVSSELDKGTIFTIFLPVEKEAQK